MFKIFITSIMLIFSSCGSGSTNSTNNKTSIEKIGKIASINEASGLCYVETSDTIFVVGDDGFIYEIDRNGKELKRKSFKNLDNHDFEGIAYDNKNKFLYIVIEGVDNLLIVDTKLNYIAEVNINRKDNQGKTILKKGGDGLEGISVQDGKIYVSNQSFELFPADDPSVIVQLDLINHDSVDIKRVIDHKHINISGVAFLDSFLYMVSDTDNLLIKYDLSNNQTIKEQHVSEIDILLENTSLEGVTFDNKGYIYFSLDDKLDGKIVKYKYR